MHTNLTVSLTGIDNGLCGLLNACDYDTGGFQWTVPRETAKNTVKHQGGGVGSVIANHCGGSKNSVTVCNTTREQQTDSGKKRRPENITNWQHYSLDLITLGVGTLCVATDQDAWWRQVCDVDCRGLKTWPVQLIAWKGSSPKRPITCQGGY